MFWLCNKRGFWSVLVCCFTRTAKKMAQKIKIYLDTRKKSLFFYNNNKKNAPQRGLQISLHINGEFLLLKIKIYGEESQQINNFWSHLFAYIKQQPCKHTCAPVKTRTTSIITMNIKARLGLSGRLYEDNLNFRKKNFFSRHKWIARHKVSLWKFMLLILLAEFM